MIILFFACVIQFTVFSAGAVSASGVAETPFPVLLPAVS